MAIRVVKISNGGGGTKLERFLPKNQHTQRKLLKFENWVNGEVSKNVDNKKCAPKLIFFNGKKKNGKDSDNFRHKKLTLKVKFWHI